MAPPPAPATIPSAALLELEHPLSFEVRGTPMFGVFHGSERTPRRVVVHVHGFGVEHLTLYRNHVRFARVAAAGGTPVFRWHARGHGDSAGDFADVTLEHLVEDALGAAAFARARAQVHEIVWLGDRLGALVAALAMERDRARGGVAAGFAAWEPVHRPIDDLRTLLRGILFSHVAHGERPRETVDQLLERLQREGTLDVHGYLLHQTFVDSARAADLLPALGAWSGPTLIAQIQARRRLAPAHAALAEALSRRGAPVTTLQIAEEPGFTFIGNPAWESPALVDGTLEWLDGLA